MTPPPLDRDVVQRRLGALADLVRDLEGDSAITAAQLQHDRRLRHAVERVLLAVVDVATSINAHLLVAHTGRAPNDQRAGFAGLVQLGVLDGTLLRDLSASVGLRNVLAHEDVETDLGLVAGAVPRAAASYGAYVQQVATWLVSRPGATD